MRQTQILSLWGVVLTALLALALGLSTLAVNRAQEPVGSADVGDLSLTKIAQPVVRPGEAITYQLTITNAGTQSASGLVLEDVLPPNTIYVSGGVLDGDRVEWTIPYLQGYGGVAEETLVLAADGDPGTEIVNDTYSAWAYSGQSVQGTLTATTRIVDDWAWITPWDAYTLTYESPDVTTLITLPVGTVSEPMTWAYEELDQALHPLALRRRTTFRSFRLSAFRLSRFSPDIRPTDSFSIVLTFSNTLGTLSAAEELLQLYRWDNGQWRKDGISCLNEASANRVACNVAPQALGEFVLTQSQHDVYLPAVYSAYQ